jgi:hypothetical protein
MRIEGNNVMKSVKVNKEELLAVVRQNKEKHVSEYSEALGDYRDAVLKVAQHNLKIAKTGDENVISQQYKSKPESPVSYEAEYNRAIRMLEMSVETELEIESQVFNQLALDEWHWKRQFSLMASSYKGML